MSIGRRFMVAAAVFGLVGCTRAHDTVESASEPTPLLEFDGPPPRNIVLFVVDTLRTDRVSLYSDATGQTATLAALSDHLFVVDDLQSASTWTGASTTSLLTSQEPLIHGVVYVVGDVGSTVLVPTWPARLTDLGWETVQFSANRQASDRHGLGATFGRSTTMEDVHASELVQATLDWLATRPDTTVPLFLHVQPLDPHQNYSPPDDLRGILESSDIPTDETAQRQRIADDASAPAEQAAADAAALRGLYGEEVLEVDRAFAALMDGLTAAGMMDDTLVVFTADHGEALGDEPTGFLFGHPSIRPAIEHIPLAFYNPRLKPGTAGGTWSQVDVVPTILGALGVTVETEPLAGIDHATASRTTAFQLHFGNNPDTPPDHRQLAITDGAVRVVWHCDGRVEAFDRLADPLEIAPVDIGDVEGGAELWAELEAHVQAQVAVGNVQVDCPAPD
jgi:arylsulfatase A-like enzyme